MLKGYCEWCCVSRAPHPMLYTGHIGTTRNTVVATYSVSPQSWKASSTALTRHSLKSRRTLGSGSTRKSSISLWKKEEGKENKSERVTKQIKVLYR